MTEHEAPPPPEEPTAPEEAPPPETVDERPDRPPFGRIALGALLLLIGIGWLLEVLDVVAVRWGALLPSALIVVGLVLVIAARTGGHGGLVALGVVLTILVTLSGTLRVPLTGGVGERVERPTTVTDLSSSYELAMGRLEVDLSGLPPGTAARVEASVGMGELVVVVPSDAGVRATGQASVGEVVLLGVAGSGFAIERTTTVPPPGGLDLDLSVGIGSVKLQEG